MINSKKSYLQAQAKEEKLAREKQREKLQLEIAARERAEKKQQEYEERLRNMAEEMERRQTELNEAQEMIRRLEEQLRQLQAAKEELEDRQTVSLFYSLRYLRTLKTHIYITVQNQENFVPIVQ